MIEKYIYAVTRELPKSSRDKTAADLSRAIHEKMNSLNANLSEEEKIERVLRELGDPRLLATKYRGKDKYLIGPKYFDNYFAVLKIVCLSIIIGISVAFGIATIFSVKSLTELIGGYTGSLLSALAQGIVWVTGIFALVEYYEISGKSIVDDKPWEPSQLADLPDEQNKISKGESIFSIIVTTLILPLVFSPGILGFYYNTQNHSKFLPLFNMEEITLFRIVIFLVFILNLLIELLKIIKGRWTFKLAVTITLLNILSSILSILAISKINIWNKKTISILELYIPFTFDRLILFITASIIIITIAESVSVLIKGYKYKNRLDNL